MDKPHIVTASELRRSSDNVLQRVAQDNRHVIVERAGHRVAALLPYAEYEALMRLRALAAHRRLVRALGASAEQQGLTEAAFAEDIEAAQRQVYAERYRNAGG